VGYECAEDAQTYNADLYDIDPVLVTPWARFWARQGILADTPPPRYRWPTFVYFSRLAGQIGILWG